MEEIQARTRPASAVSPWTGAVGLLALLAVILPLKTLAAADPVGAALALMAAMTLPMAGLELFRLRSYRAPSAGLRFLDDPAPRDPGRVGYKLAGYFAALGALWLMYGVLPIYADGRDFGSFQHLFSNFRKLVERSWGWIVLAPVPYFAWLDRRMKEPRDGYWHAGRFVLLEWQGVDRKGVAHFARSWLIKGVFLPLMTGQLVNMMEWYGAHHEALTTFSAFYNFFYEFVWLLDLAVCALGYVFTVRILDSHIRSAEPVFLGWFAALVCYPPFWQKVTYDFLKYGDGYGWGTWLREDPEKFAYIYPVWGSMIVAVMVVYILAEYSFGLRFSNLTNRGIVTSGPYRFCKHPSYLAKNLSWWLISVPFVPHEGAWAAFVHSVLLLCVNGIYFLRARTEERHLSADPAYVEYALWMNENGWLAPLGRVLPFLRYRAPGPVSEG